jgi:hypothetical protein
MRITRLLISTVFLIVLASSNAIAQSPEEDFPDRFHTLKAQLTWSPRPTISGQLFVFPVLPSNVKTS